jgi:hypothetical protein
MDSLVAGEEREEQRLQMTPSVKLLDSFWSDWENYKRYRSRERRPGS